ncbi:MAG: porphobilinogen synthase [Anaerolineaceae bacterium]|nr:porphobilinogen synthase [Anaerolineaceae bacterium]
MNSQHEPNPTISFKSRPRRLRTSPGIRSMMRETRLESSDFIYPLFVMHGKGIKQEISSMPGVFQWSPDLLADEAKSIAELGIPAVILFGIPESKDPVGLENFSENGIIQQSIRVIKQSVPDMVVITDVCLCEYTDHGHCGILNLGENKNPNLPEGYVLNDETLEILAKVAVSHAQAGADMVAPSGMMDGMVAAIRNGLDAHHFEHIPILSYSVKYASSFYSPFREAAQGTPKFGDRQSHQMDPANIREALREAALDVQEGADALMVKPALPYLDVIHLLRQTYPELTLAAYNVSGEYAMIKAAAANGWLDERRTILEILLSMKRAGADLIITYHAKEAAQWLKENQ